MRLRDATPSDAPRIAALILSHRALLTVDPNGKGAEEFFEQVSEPAVRGYLDSPRYDYLVADDGDDLAGFIAIRDRNHLYHLFVASGHQGRGLGRRLWQEARRRAESAGSTGEFTVKASPNAVPVYARFGFESVGPRTEKHGVAFVPMRLGVVTIRPVKEADADGWLEMRCALWPEGSDTEHRDEITRFFEGSFPRRPWAVLLAERDGSLLGFVELSIRPFAEGCRTHRVAYLEGWFVRSDARRQGVGGALIDAAQEWGRAQGCTEFASDAHPDNDLSSSVHRALGFADVGLVRCFRKEL